MDTSTGRGRVRTEAETGGRGHQPRNPGTPGAGGRENPPGASGGRADPPRSFPDLCPPSRERMFTCCVGPPPAGGTLSRQPRDTDHREGQEGPPEDRRCGVAGAQQGHSSFQNHGGCSVSRLHRRETSPGGVARSHPSFPPVRRGLPGVPTPRPCCHGAGAQRGELGAGRHVHPRPLTQQSTRPSL